MNYPGDRWVSHKSWTTRVTDGSVTSHELPGWQMGQTGQAMNHTGVSQHHWTEHWTTLPVAAVPECGGRCHWLLTWHPFNLFDTCSTVYGRTDRYIFVFNAQRTAKIISRRLEMYCYHKYNSDWLFMAQFTGDDQTTVTNPTLDESGRRKLGRLLFIYLLNVHSLVNRTWSPQGFSLSHILHKLNTIQNMHIYRRKTYKHNLKVSPC